MTYAEKLKDPRWQKKRLQILERDHWMCQNCYDTKSTLHVHHLDYEKGFDPWEYPDFYLLTLCEKCHSEIPERQKDWEKSIIELFRLTITTDFLRSCLDEISRNTHIFDRLIFLLYDVGVDDSVSLLEKEHDARYVSAIKKYEAAKNPCPACGSKLIYHEQYNVVKCNLCGYVPEYEMKLLPPSKQEYNV